MGDPGSVQPIEPFLSLLKQQKNTATVTNPYLDGGAVNNLRLYLQYLSKYWFKNGFEQGGRRILLVGEAPGYKGCRITGIPFSSVKVLMGSEHPLFHAIRPKLSLSEQALSEMPSENTATIVWEYLVWQYLSKIKNRSDQAFPQTLPQTLSQTLPLFWNSFPFHPHKKNRDNTNRAPNSREIAQGIIYLQQIYLIFQPEIVAGIGHKGVECAKKAFPSLAIGYIRHPSYGGKAEFIAAMNRLLQ